MTEDDLSRIETELGVRLPTAYRALMLARGAEFRAAKLGHWLWAKADRVVRENLDERNPQLGTAGAYPEWWETYLLIGDNGDCEFFCLRLDGEPAVYKISADDDGPEKVADSLDGYLESEPIQDRLNPPPPSAVKVACLCCGSRTIGRRGKYEQCPVCLWHDDGRREDQADEIVGDGIANAYTTLAEARTNYEQYRVFSMRFLGQGRAAGPEERPA